MRMTNTSSSRLRRSRLRRAIIGVTAVGSTNATLMTANAEIVYSGPQNLSTSTLLGTDPFNGDQEVVNLDGAGGDEFTLDSFATKGSNFHDMQNLSPDIEVIQNPAASYILKIDAGSTIGAEGYIFGTPAIGLFIDNLSDFNPNAQWTGGSDGCFGFRFNPSGSQDLYGWGHITFSADAKIMTLVDWAYENTGAPIQACTVPEPAASLLLTAGLIFAAIWRRH